VGARFARARTQPAVKPPSSLQASDRSSSQASVVELVLLLDTISTSMMSVELLVRLPK
jgi:hypothetical protein